jgi:EAL domain-containing protein (putative c-di-GMP-specific phosphodiesterase class I)
MNLAQLRVMVVEDHGFQRRMAMRLLDACGVRLLSEAADGQAALALLEAMPQLADVVIVDLDMPGMDGVELIGHIAQRKLAHAVVVASALDPALLNTVQSMARAYGLRVLGSVEKPLTTPKLSEVLERYGSAVEELPPDCLVQPSRDELLAALRGDEIVPFFQPQVTFSNGQALAIEALARWRRADGSLLRPEQFLPAVEREGLLDPLTEHMLARACEWKQRLQRGGLSLKIAVNVSMLNLTRIEAADRYQAIVREHGVEPAEVMLEITESSVMGEAAHALHVLARLRLKGFGLSIDDFGTGYSSLSQLSQIPFTELKIDQSFVAGAPRQPRKRAVIEASLELARKLNLSVVAEGVQTVDEWQMLAALGCDYAQGYLISRPTPGDQLAAAIARWRRPQT